MFQSWFFQKHFPNPMSPFTPPLPLVTSETLFLGKYNLIFSSFVIYVRVNNFMHLYSIFFFVFKLNTVVLLMQVHDAGELDTEGGGVPDHKRRADARRESKIELGFLRHNMDGA